MGVLPSFDDSQKIFPGLSNFGVRETFIFTCLFSGEAKFGYTRDVLHWCITQRRKKSIRLLSTTQSSGMARHLCFYHITRKVQRHVNQQLYTVDSRLQLTNSAKAVNKASSFSLHLTTKHSSLPSSVPAKLVKMPIRVVALAFDLFVLYAITARALKLSLSIEKTIKEWNFPIY
jgi:hypothetical protein